MAKRLNELDFYRGMLGALAVVAAHDAETIYREIVQSTNQDELIRVARKDGIMRWSGLWRYHYGQKE